MPRLVTIVTVICGFIRMYIKVLSGSSASHKGALIIGDSGHGKTAVIEQLVEWSVFGRNIKDSSTGNTMRFSRW